MNLQRSPERGLCLVAAFAMALDVPAESLLTEIGENWKILAFPDLPTPYCWRGVHVQEMIHAALRRGRAVTPIEVFPQTAPPYVCNPKTGARYSEAVVLYGSEEENWARFHEVILKYRGVLTGTLALSRLFQRGHAVAFERGIIFDPDLDAYLYSIPGCEQHNFYPSIAYRIDQMEPSYVQFIQPNLKVNHADINH